MDKLFPGDVILMWDNSFLITLLVRTASPDWIGVSTSKKEKYVFQTYTLRDQYTLRSRKQRKKDETANETL